MPQTNGRKQSEGSLKKATTKSTRKVTLKGKTTAKRTRKVTPKGKTTTKRTRKVTPRAKSQTRGSGLLQKGGTGVPGRPSPTRGTVKLVDVVRDLAGRVQQLENASVLLKNALCGPPSGVANAVYGPPSGVPNAPAGRTSRGDNGGVVSAIGRGLTKVGRAGAKLVNEQVDPKTIKKIRRSASGIIDTGATIAANNLDRVNSRARLYGMATPFMG